MGDVTINITPVRGAGTARKRDASEFVSPEVLRYEKKVRSFWFFFFFFFFFFFCHRFPSSFRKLIPFRVLSVLLVDGNAEHVIGRTPHLRRIVCFVWMKNKKNWKVIRNIHCDASSPISPDVSATSRLFISGTIV